MTWRLIISGFALLLFVTAKCLSAELYAGEPLGEALFDLSRNAVLIAHDLSSGSPLNRTDVFKLSDGRLVALTSTADGIGQPFRVREIRVSSAGNFVLTKKDPTVNKVEFSSK
jgi:hypothetical protein